MRIKSGEEVLHDLPIIIIALVGIKFLDNVVVAVWHWLK